MYMYISTTAFAYVRAKAMMVVFYMFVISSHRTAAC